MQPSAPRAPDTAPTLRVAAALSAHAVSEVRALAKDLRSADLRWVGGFAFLAPLGPPGLGAQLVYDAEIDEVLTGYTAPPEEARASHALRAAAGRPFESRPAQAARRRVLLHDGLALTLFSYRPIVDYRQLDGNQRMFFMGFVAAHWRGCVELDSAAFTLEPRAMRFQLQYARPAPPDPVRDNFTALARCYGFADRGLTRLEAFCGHLCSLGAFWQLLRQLHEAALERGLYERLPEPLLDDTRAGRLAELAQREFGAFGLNKSLRSALADRRYGLSLGYVVNALRQLWSHTAANAGELGRCLRAAEAVLAGVLELCADFVPRVFALYELAA